MLNATRRRAYSQDQIKNLSRHAVGSKRERKPQRACIYYSTARNKKKGAYTMSANEMTSKIRELKELQALIEEAEAEAEAIREQIKKAMGESEELRAGEYKVTYKTVKSSRFDSKSLKADLPEIAARYTVPTEYRRFAIA